MRRRGECRFSTSQFARCTPRCSCAILAASKLEHPSDSCDSPNPQGTLMTSPAALNKPPRLITTAIFAALAMSCGALSVADADDVPQAVVKFGDLNLASPQGAAALYGRIVVAAYEVCKSFDIDMHGLEFPLEQLACVHKAVARAVTNVGRPELFAIYNARNPHPLPITVAAVPNR